MDAKELRIGNYVITDALLIPRPLIGKDKAQPMSAWGLWLYSAGEFEIQPIPLTEEWLIRFGFVLYKRTLKYNIYIKNGDISIKIKSLISSFRIYGFGIEIQYVHQLQNLFFALTGKELTL